VLLVLTEALKAAAPLLAVLLPCIAAFFAYRGIERRPATVGQPGMMAIGGVLADRDAASQYGDALSSLSISVSSLTQAVLGAVAEGRKAGKQSDELIDEAKEIRRALEEMVDVLKRTRRHSD
jgi:hypothetical protein